MKKYFILAAAAIVALAACSKNNVETPVAKEISYNAVAGKNTVTKAIINTAVYAPSAPSFGIWGLYQATQWSTNHAGDQFWVGTNSTTPAHITYQTDTWKNVTTDYWPLSGKLVFMGYTPFYYVGESGTAVPATIGVADNKVNLTVSGFASATGNYVADLMWSDAVEKTANDENYDADGTGDATYNGVPVVFHHALSQIIVTAKTDKVYTGYTFNITNITLTVDDNANLTVADDLSAAPTVTWTEPATDASPVIVSSATANLTNSYVAQGSPILVIPQSLTAAQDILSITYQVTHNGVTSSKTKTIDLRTASLTAFAANTKYNLNLELSLTEIKYSPSVEDWTGPTDSNYSVPVN